MGNDINSILNTLRALAEPNGLVTSDIEWAKDKLEHLIAQETNKAVIAELEFEQRYFNKFPFQEFIDKYVSDRIKALKAKEQA
jgi:hypothetical protein